MFGRGVLPLVRVRENNTLSIRQALDNGAGGVIVPMINNHTEAKKAVVSAKYPPDGIRGYAFSRANKYGLEFDQYVKSANEETLVIVMIETKSAVANAWDIIRTNGVDGVFIGPYDLSGSYGVPGNINHPDVIEGQKEVLEMCKGAGKAAGIHLVSPDEQSVKKAIEDGFTFIALSMDTVFLSNAASGLLNLAKPFLVSR